MICNMSYFFLMPEELQFLGMSIIKNVNRDEQGECRRMINNYTASSVLGTMQGALYMSSCIFCVDIPVYIFFFLKEILHIIYDIHPLIEGRNDSGQNPV